MAMRIGVYSIFEQQGDESIEERVCRELARTIVIQFRLSPIRKER